ncbi:uncharacterized protein LTR77_000143 [Saxophila tyrrhenica]|uniref:Glyoxalase-like domain-containing protein n=1 Tax=Saxophila tyrrhenica TaxID=1690608 RepID=A0AAV9PME9_9PEZI|nr:hypothetical protein LTR77_000143 [Saxophila tyrrhenica]
MPPKKPGPPNTFGTGPVRLRQIALVARDLAKARRLLTYVLGTEVIYEDPEVAQWGLANILVPVGGEIIEVVSPTRDGTTAGRLLEKKGVDEAGYMIIMQNEDAKKRREFIEEKEMAKVIFSHEVKGKSGEEEGWCVQYHPKGIRGGVIPELDSHAPTKSNPEPLRTRFSPWHPCGPDVERYTAKMKEYRHLSLIGAVCRLAPGDWGAELASTQWEQTFGIPRSRDLCQFTNARVGFVHGEEGELEGMVSVSVGVVGERRRKAIFDRAREMGALKEERERRYVDMVGVRWNFSLTGEDEWEGSRL